MTEENKETEEKKETKKHKSDKDDNVVFIGSKPFMNYVRAVEVQFGREGCNEVVVKARGKFISRAVDVEQVVKHGPIGKTVSTKNLITNSEQFENKEGKKVNVSTIEITLNK
tara:strand:+ start:63 stop:398 length:336 start_codon:yes stop_codon:yes gene_type:complete